MKASEPARQVANAFPLFPIMFLIFMTLKLTGHITWSWWWVTAPLWGWIVAVLTLFAIGAIVIIAYHFLKGWFS